MVAIDERTDERSLRERKKSQTRDDLATAALALFVARGFDAVTVDEIAAAAGVSPRTFFRYFGSKEAVLFADQDEIIEVLHASLSTRPQHESPLQALRSALRELSDHYAAHREQHLWRAQLVEDGASIGTYQWAVLRPRWENALTEIIAHRSGFDPVTGLLPRVLAGVAIGALTAASAAWLVSDGRVDVSELIDRAFDELETAVSEIRTTA